MNRARLKKRAKKNYISYEYIKLYCKNNNVDYDLYLSWMLEAFRRQSSMLFDNIGIFPVMTKIQIVEGFGVHGMVGLNVLDIDGVLEDMKKYIVKNNRKW